MIQCGLSELAHIRMIRQVTISAINRNFQGRSGPGQLYLASPLTVMVSAFTGQITAWHPEIFSDI